MRRRRWALGVLVAYVACAAAVLLAPVSPSAAVDAITAWIREDAGLGWVRQGWVEFAGNVLLFVPIGALVTACVARPWRGLLAAVALSVAAELVQLLLPARTASLRDVVANAAGAALGGLVAWLVIARRSRPGRPRATRRAP